MKKHLGVFVATLVVLSLLFVTAAHAQMVPPPQRPDPTPEWLKLDAEYRVQTIYINPLELNGTEVTETWWTEQRARVDLGLKYKAIGGFYLKLDILNGVLFGDNGTFGEDPSPNSGLAIASKVPNSAGWTVGLVPGRDPLDVNSYQPVLEAIDPIQVTYAYGEVLLPFGIFRAGRMVQSDAAGIAAHDGERRNRWGVSRSPDLADRVLFATKLDEIYNTLTLGDAHTPNPSINDGVLMAFTWDWNVQDNIHVIEDNLSQTNFFLSWRVQEADWFGLKWKDFQLSQVFVHKFGDQFDSSLWAFPFRLEGTAGNAYFNLQISHIRGESREVSEGLAELSGSDPAVQEFNQLGVHAFYEYDFGPVALAMEFDFASGDADPRSGSPLTSFSFAKDFNVGLLLFEHILAFQTARTAAVGLENLAQLDAEAFPLTELASEGRFTNAYGFFPQARIDWVETPRHKFHTRLGVLTAIGAEKVVDSVVTSLSEDGDEIDDDAVNFHGGVPARYYGTELDLQLQWTYEDFFTWTIETAVLFPGEALHDRNGQAVNSFMIENRLLFVF